MLVSRREPAGRLPSLAASDAPSLAYTTGAWTPRACSTVAPGAAMTVASSLPPPSLEAAMATAFSFSISPAVGAEAEANEGFLQI